MQQSERSPGSLQPDNTANRCPRKQDHPAYRLPSALHGDMQAGPDKCDDQQNKKTPIIFPETGDEYLQQHDSAQEGNVAEVVQVGIGKIDCQDQKSVV